MYGQQNIKF